MNLPATNPGDDDATETFTRGISADDLTNAILATASTDTLGAKTDAELADLLVENVLAEERVPSPRFFLLQAVVERLRSWIPAAQSGVVLVSDGERGELLAHARSFTFGSYTAHDDGYITRGDDERWGVCDARGRAMLPAEGDTRTRLTRDEAVRVAKALDAKARGL